MFLLFSLVYFLKVLSKSLDLLFEIVFHFLDFIYTLGDIHGHIAWNIILEETLSSIIEWISSAFYLDFLAIVKVHGSVFNYFLAQRVDVLSFEFEGLGWLFENGHFFDNLWELSLRNIAFLEVLYQFLRLLKVMLYLVLLHKLCRLFK